MCIFGSICKYWFFLQLIQFLSILNKRITSQKVHHPRDGFVKRHGTNGFDLGHSVSSTNHINFDEGILRNSERVFFFGGGVRPMRGVAQETGIWTWNLDLRNRVKIGSPSNKSEDTSPMLCSNVTHFESEESPKKSLKLISLGPPLLGPIRYPLGCRKSNIQETEKLHRTHRHGMLPKFERFVSSKKKTKKKKSNSHSSFSGETHMIWSSYKNFRHSKSRHKLTLRFATKSFSKSHKRIKRIDTRSTPGRIGGLPPKPHFGQRPWVGIGCFHCTDLHFGMSNILRNYRYILTNIIRRINILENIAILFEERNPPQTARSPQRAPKNQNRRIPGTIANGVRRIA